MRGFTYFEQGIRKEGKRKDSLYWGLPFSILFPGFEFEWIRAHEVM